MQETTQLITANDTTKHHLSLDEKVEWARQMRLTFSLPEMLNPDGSLKQSYFLPKDVIVKERRQWTEIERDLLLQGIKKYGVGNFQDILKEFLPEWTVKDLRIRTMRLIGRQNLQAYKGWRGTEEDIQKIYEKNKDIGVKLGAWKGGMLVADDEGKVGAYLEALGE